MHSIRVNRTYTHNINATRHIHTASQQQDRDSLPSPHGLGAEPLRPAAAALATDALAQRAAINSRAKPCAAACRAHGELQHTLSPSAGDTVHMALDMAVTWEHTHTTHTHGTHTLSPHTVTPTHTPRPLPPTHAPQRRRVAHRVFIYLGGRLLYRRHPIVIRVVL